MASDPTRDRISDERLHDLKVWPHYFAALASGRKTFEVRKDDRGFREGDALLLREWRPDTETYTGARVEASISYILHGGQFGVADGYVVLGLAHRAAEAQRPTCATCKEWTGRTNGPMRQVANCKQGVSIGSGPDQTPYNFHCAFYEAVAVSRWRRAVGHGDCPQRPTSGSDSSRGVT